MVSSASQLSREETWLDVGEDYLLELLVDKDVSLLPERTIFQTMEVVAARQCPGPLFSRYEDHLFDGDGDFGPLMVSGFSFRRRRGENDAMIVSVGRIGVRTL